MERAHSEKYMMQLAIEEHVQCTEYPRVGAVVAKDGKVLSTGRRGEIAKVHAERVAIGKISPSDLIEATIYTTLEPCVDLYDQQAVGSCTDLIIESGIRRVVIGVLDPNASIYTQGYRKLLENNISVAFFDRKLRDDIEQITFEYGSVDRFVGGGKRRVPVFGSGITINVQFSEKDPRTIPISWNTLQFEHGIVDLLSENGAVRTAKGARNFKDITAPDVFRFPAHYARMKVGDIAVVKPSGATFCVLVQLIKLFPYDVLI